MKSSRQSRKTKRAKGLWVLSEAAPFIRKILSPRVTDAERTQVAREFADWLDAKGDKGDEAKWFRHPKLQWRHRGDYVSWEVSPWGNGGHGCGCRIDTDWWTLRYPTREYVKSKDAEDMVRAWLQNRAAQEEYPWTREVAVRIGLVAEYDYQVTDRAHRKRMYEEDRRVRWVADRERYAELQREIYRDVRWESGGGI